MGYLRGYTTFTKDPEWPIKFLLAALCLVLASCVPVITQAIVMGWTAMAIRHAVLSATQTPLPTFSVEVDYLVELMMSGLKQFGIMLIWMLPAFVLIAAIAFPLMFAMTASAMGEDDSIAFLGPCIALVLFPLILLLSLPAQVALLRVELCDEFSAGLAFKEIFNFTRMMFLELIVGLLLVSLVGMLVSILGFVMLCVGVFPASVLVTYALAQCRAYIYERYLDKGGEPWTVARPVEGAFPQSPTYRDPAVFA